MASIQSHHGIEDPSRKSAPKLPTELLLKILEEYVCFPAELARCMLVNKHWRMICRPLLYEDVALDAWSLVDWAYGSRDVDGALIKTLTIRNDSMFVPVEPNTHLRTRDDNLSQHDLLGKSVVRLHERRFGTMDQLISLSLFRPPSAIYAGYHISKFDFSEILKNLPPSLRHLEIDMPGLRNGEDLGSTHVCPIIRGIIPQLYTLHIRMKHICPDVLGSGFDRADPMAVDEKFEPVKADQLEELMIKILLPYGGPAFRRAEMCGSDEWQLHNRDAGIPIIEHLRKFATAPNLPNLRKVWVMDETSVSHQEYAYRAIVRRDIIANKSCALPYKNIGGFRKDGYWIRMPEDEGGKDFVSTYPTIWEIAEGRRWIETINGCRIPVSAKAASKIYVPRASTILMAEQYKQKTGISSVLWENEWRLGIRMLHARKGELMASDAPTETVPQGWQRNLVGELLRIDIEGQHQNA